MRQQHIFWIAAFWAQANFCSQATLYGKMSLQWLLTDFLTGKNVRKWTKRFEESDEVTEFTVAMVAIGTREQHKELTGKQCFAAAMYAYTVKPDLFATLDLQAQALMYLRRMCTSSILSSPFHLLTH